MRDPSTHLYGYVPTEWICILFVVLFSLSTLVHLCQAVHSRLWWLLPTTVLCGITEIIGWSGRLWSSKNPTNLNPFLMQISTTIIAPTMLIAASFIVLGQIIRRLGQQYSRLSAWWYTIIFISCDIIALVIQAVGGAKASIAAQNGDNPSSGGNVMLGGIAFQLAAVCVYLAFASEFLVRYFRDRPVRAVSAMETKRPALAAAVRLMLLALALDGVLILIRSIYRTIELSDGWTGRIITTQVYFNALDGGAILLALFTLNVFHPGRLLGKAHTWAGREKCAAPSASSQVTAV
ncbi:RTA1-domain-containing protein [Epithele typhae]|uniref:RTA1-domain-containing protein n=1 Tax=Epithele typhae TaxID=378194 RepID=UPI0020084CEF|nr:RTA1-domain-containing protein [Epithele typhae]KAH9914183.1 RTA1-domain-containing protein [Epithele typhae]